jgi:hypothetical protein
MGRVHRSPVWDDPRVKPPYGSVEVDWAHPMALNLVSAFLFNEAAGVPVNILNQAIATSFPDGPGAWGKGVKGSALSFQGSFGDDLGFTLSGTSSTANVTMASQFLLSTLDLWRPILKSTAVTSTWAGLTTSGDAAHDFTFSWDNAGQEYNAATGLTLVTGVPYTGIASLTPTGAELRLGSPTDIKTYTDANANTAQSMDGLWRIGRDSSNFMYLHGLVFSSTIWQRTLTTSEQLQYIAEPYAFLRPIIRRRYFVPAGAAAAGSTVRRRLTLLGVGS